MSRLSALMVLLALSGVLSPLHAAKPHNRTKMIDGRKETWFDFQIASLKEAGASLHYLKK